MGKRDTHEKRPDYDSPEGIAGFLEGLSGLHGLVAARERAWKRREKLTPYCLLGRWYLTSFGELCRLIDQVPADLGLAMSPVATDDELLKTLAARFGRAQARVAYAMGAPPPPAHVRCAECGAYWIIEDAHDAVVHAETRRMLLNDFAGGFARDMLERLQRDEAGIWQALEIPCALDQIVWPGEVGKFRFYRWRHVACAREAILREELWRFERMLEEAGLEHVEVRPIEAPADCAGPAFKVELGRNPVRLLRSVRDSVTIDWQESERALPDLFRNEHKDGHRVERGPTFVRAPDENYAVRYLRRLAQALTG